MPERDPPMAERCPQNPVFAVDQAAFDACLPKGICPACGTVIAVKPTRQNGRMRCPGCDISLVILEENGRWTLEAADASAPPESK